MWNLVKKRLPKPLDRATGDLTNKRVIVDQTDEMSNVVYDDSCTS